MAQEKSVGTGVLLKSSFWYTLSSFLSKAMVFITTPIFARMLTNEEYGDFTVFASWQAIFLIICGVEIYGTINRARFDYENEDEYNSYISSGLVVSTIITGIFFIIFLIFPDLYYRFFLLDRKYILVMFLYLFTYPALAMFQAKQRVEYKYKVAAAISFSLVISSAILAVALGYSMKNNRLFGRVIGQYSLYSLVGIIFYIYFLKNSHKIDWDKCKYALRLGVPLVFSYLGGQIMLSSDNLVLKHMCSAAEVSYLSATHTCAHIVLILVQTLNGAWAPFFYDKLHEKNYKTIVRVFKIYISVIVVMTFGVLLFAPEIIMIFGGAKYAPALYLLPLNIMCSVFNALTSQFSNLETYNKKPEYSAILTAIVALLNVGLDIIGVNLFGYQAVCYATILCQIVLVVLHYRMTIKMDVKEIIPMKLVAAVIVISLFLIPISFMLYKNNIVRFSLIAIIGLSVAIVGVIKKNELVALIKKIKK